MNPRIFPDTSHEKNIMPFNLSHKKSKQIFMYEIFQSVDCFP